MSDYGYRNIGYFSRYKVFDPNDKNSLVEYHIRNSFRKTQSMFDYKGLPDTIPKRILELNLQSTGYMTWLKHNDKLYALYGELGGVPDENYMPTISIISNPALKLFKTFEINKDCVVMPNDSLYEGIYNINKYYSNQLADNDLSRRMIMINLRALAVFIAKNNDDKLDCEKFLKSLEEGKLDVITSKSFMDKLELLPFGSEYKGQTIIQLLEDKQYIKGSWLNELGVQSNYNMKRETITSNENILNVDGLLPLVDDMLYCRKQALEKINKMFNTEIEVELSSAWKKIRTEIKISEDRQQKEVANLDNKNDSDKIQLNGNEKKDGDKDEVERDNK